MPPWAAIPGLPVRGTLILEAFGQLSRRQDLAGRDEDDSVLWALFMSRADLMRWCAVSGSTWSDGYVQAPMPGLWGVEEAEVTAEAEDSQIAYAQVGLEAGVEPATALPPMVQCFDDALHRIGDVEVSALQMTVRNLTRDAGSNARELLSSLYWLVTMQGPSADALLVFDNDLVGEHDAAAFADGLRQMNNEWLSFGRLVPVPEEHSIKVMADASPHLRPSKPGGPNFAVPVTMPGWDASAVGCVLAIVLDAALTASPDARNFTVRLSRV